MVILKIAESSTFIKTTKELCIERVQACTR